jgi:addiction module HigA family antidote
MKHSDFSIGKIFYTATGEWKCTDVGTRTIACIKTKEGWMEGPPYALQEQVFDENDFGGCWEKNEGPMPFEPDWYSAPGDTIKDCLRERDLSVAKFAWLMKLPYPMVKNLIDGKEKITPEIAVKLTNVLGSTFAFWMRRDDQYMQAYIRKENKSPWERITPEEFEATFEFHPGDHQEIKEKCLRPEEVKDALKWWHSLSDEDRARLMRLQLFWHPNDGLGGFA